MSKTMNEANQIDESELVFIEGETAIFSLVGWTAEGCPPS
jgi:hypothetical protein